MPASGDSNRDHWTARRTRFAQNKALSRIMQQKIAERKQQIEQWEPGLAEKVKRLQQRCLDNRAVLLPLCEQRFADCGWRVHSVHSSAQLNLLFRSLFTGQTLSVDPSLTEKNLFEDLVAPDSPWSISSLARENRSTRNTAPSSAPSNSWCVLEAAAVVANSGCLVFSDPTGMIIAQFARPPRLFVLARAKQLVPDLRDAFRLLRLENYLLYGNALPPASMIYRPPTRHEQQATHLDADGPPHHLAIWLGED